MLLPVSTRGPIPVELVAASRSVSEPRWAPGGAALGWVESGVGGGDVVVAPVTGRRGPRVVTATMSLGASGFAGGGTWCWAGPEHLVVAAADGRLVVVGTDGVVVGVLSGEGRASAPSIAPGRDVVAFVWERDDACDVAVVDLQGGTGPTVVSRAGFAWDPAWSPDGSRLAWHEWDVGVMPWEASRIVLAEAAHGEGRTVAGDPGGDASGEGIAVGQPRFSPDGTRLAWLSDESGWANVTVARADGTQPAPLVAESHEHGEPSWGPGQRSFAWAPDSRAIAFCRNEAGFGRLVAAPLARRRAGSGRGAPVALSKGWHHGLDWGPGGIAAVRSGARTPREVIVVAPSAARSPRRRTGFAARGWRGAVTRRALAYAAPAGYEAAGLVEPEAVCWPTDDGTTVFGQLYRPGGSPASGPPSGAPPLLVDVHGGPTGQATVQWRPFVQYFVSRGWAVLTPDFRGSTGYGRAYARALSGEWGVRDVADCAAGIRVARERGWADPTRVAVCGGSAGGLTALLLAARHGPLVRAVVSQYGVTDLLGLAATTHRLEARYLDDLVGPLPAGADRYRERSPVAHAGSIRVPTLVLHGADDRVVPAEQAGRLVEEIRAAGGVVEHRVYPGEGHGWTRPETVLDVYPRIEAFLARWVLGR